MQARPWSIEAAVDRALDPHRTSHAVAVADLLNKNRAARRVCEPSRYCPMLTPGQARTMTCERLDLDTTVSNATALPSRETRKVGSMKPPYVRPSKSGYPHGIGREDARHASRNLIGRLRGGRGQT